MTSGFVDYFVVAGLAVGSGLEPDTLSGDNLHCPPLDRPYKSKVLQHFPSNVPRNPFDENAVGMLCLPKGLTFRTDRQTRDPTFHTFIITREDGSNTYGAAYTFYEQVESEKICAAMKTLHSMYSAELSNDQSLTLYSETLQSPGTPRTKRRQKDLEDANKLYNHSFDNLFVSKCISLLSPMPFVDCFYQILSSLYEACCQEIAPNLPLESYIYNILHEVPAPSSGTSIQFTCLAKTIVCQIPGSKELPFFDFNLQDIFISLGVENVINVFTSILLEHQVLLYSKNYSQLMVVAESLRVLIFPFTWQHVYVPILPASMLHFLDAPVPFIMGLHRGEEERAQLKQQLTEGFVCLVDIDCGEVNLPEELPDFPQKLDFIEEVFKVLKDYNIAHRWRFTDETGAASENNSGKSSLSPELRNVSEEKMKKLENNVTLARLKAIAQKSRVVSSDDIQSVFEECWSQNFTRSGSSSSIRNSQAKAIHDKVSALKFNNAIREMFLHQFLILFCDYDDFTLKPKDKKSLEDWSSNRDSMQTYDKVAFLSQQPDMHRPFISSFIETQMFTTFIDNKIMSMWESPDPYLRLFDERKHTVKSLRERHVYHPCPTVQGYGPLIEQRHSQNDQSTLKPHPLKATAKPQSYRKGYFPVLDEKSLEEGKSMQDKDNVNRGDILPVKSLSPLSGNGTFQFKGNIQQPKLDRSQASIDNTNWKFVETLLAEVKAKTKRMLVVKMGQEAVDLGHGEQCNENTIGEVEENTLITSLFDVLERIWSHGLQTKKGKSALWSHLLKFQDIFDSLKDTSLLPEPLAVRSQPSSPYLRRHSSKTPDLPILRKLESSALSDMRIVQGMHEIMSDVGYAKAWVKLALEKKVLSKHLKEVISKPDLLRILYKRYAFLRCEDEREQLQFHLLSLNAVDYHSFTNTFSDTKVLYRILIYPTKNKFQSYTTSANVWLSMSGQLGETDVMRLPKNTFELCLELKNLGMLSTLRIGHDDSGLSSRWLIDYILVRNELTGHLFRFPCGRWLGRGVDDGSIERLLVAEPIAIAGDVDELNVSCGTPPRSMSPATPRKSSATTEQWNMAADLQQMLGDAVNRIVKCVYKSDKESGSLTALLCGELGIVNSLERVFSYGFKSTRFLVRRVFLWDYLEKNSTLFQKALCDGEVESNLTEVYRSYCRVVSGINSSSSRVGKDGKFQLFACIGLRDQAIQSWFKALHETKVTADMYEEASFLRNERLFICVLQLLNSLEGFKINLEPSLLKGIDI